MARSITKRPTNIEEENMGSVGRWGLLPKQCPIQEGVEGREYELQSPHILHATKDKHQPARITELNKHEGNRNGVKAKKKQNSDGVEHTQRVKAPPTCTQPIHGKWGTGQGFQRVWYGREEKMGVYFRVPAQTSLERDVLLEWHLTQKR